jgi:hypothetical protein
MKIAITRTLTDLITNKKWLAFGENVPEDNYEAVISAFMFEIKNMPLSDFKKFIDEL